MLIQGDCIEQMKLMKENSVDAIITDPPYGIGFMGKEWDNFKPETIKEGMEKDKRPKTQIASTRISNIAGTYDLSLSGNQKFQEWFKQVSIQCLRVLKPGGFLLVFGGTRTYHRLVCGIEDAGFEIRDTIMWLYGSGFPKSLNIGKQIDKLQGNEREEIGEGKGKSYIHQNEINVEQGFRPKNYYKDNDGKFEITKGNSEWEGWGTALKPACEPIVVARKPLSEKNVALNVLKWGTGGINIDDCRIETNPEVDDMKREVYRGERDKESDWAKNSGFKNETNKYTGVPVEGRFPANIILDEEAGKMLDEQSGELKSGDMQGKKGGFGNSQLVYGENSEKPEAISFGDKGGASRFFYCAKASKSERNLGCEEMEQKDSRKEDGSSKSLEIFSNQYTKSSGNPTGRGITSKRANNHPTVKPIKLMEYLVKLVSREGATVLDPFLGSGTTLIACVKLGRKGIGIEKEEEYCEIAKKRLKPYLEQTKLKIPTKSEVYNENKTKFTQEK